MKGTADHFSARLIEIVPSVDSPTGVGNGVGAGHVNASRC